MLNVNERNSVWRKNSEQDVINAYSSWEKSQTFIQKGFEIFYFTRAAIDILNTSEELNSELHCTVYYSLLRRKMITEIIITINNNY